MSSVKVADEVVDKRRGREHIGVSVGAVVHDGTGRILLMKRGPKARDEHGNWDVCGGTIEFGESVDETIRREVREELCTETFEIDFLTAYEAIRQHNGTQTHWIILINAVRVDPSKVKIGEPEKISEIGWFTLDTLPSPMHSQFHKALEAIKQSGIAG